jgi:hypothetical protein
VNAGEGEEAVMRRRVRLGLAGVLSAKCLLCILRYRSVGSMLSVGSILGFKCAGSTLSIRRAGSILSVGSAGAILNRRREEGETQELEEGWAARL